MDEQTLRELYEKANQFGKLAFVELLAPRAQWRRSVVTYFNFGLLDHNETLRAMERFAREVMPHFAEKKASVAV